MKKISKILFVVMALALAISAFAVSASAEDTVVTNSQLYIGEYESSTHSGMAHIVFGTVSNAEVEYGVIIEDAEGLRFKFPGKAIGNTGKFGIAIYDLPEGTYKAQAYTGADDARTLGEQTTFTMGKATYTVTLDYNGATGFDSTEILVAQGSALEEIDMTNVTLGGANFVEWRGANGLEYDFSTILTSDITLSAIFESKYGTDMMYTYTTTGVTYFGINECVNVGLGGSVVWQFDCLAYENTSSQIRLVAGSATAASGNAMQYKPAWGEASCVMGFAANNAKDWYGGDYGKTGGKETMFKADYSYKLEYIAPTGQYVADGSFKLYECETAKVGTDAESWSNTFYLTGVNNVEGGNSFAPITSVNLNIYIGDKDVKFATANNTLTVNGGDAQDVTMGIIGTPDWDYVPYVKYSTAKKITMSGDSFWGNADGIDIGYDGQLTWQFDIVSATMGGRWNIAMSHVAISQLTSTPSMIRWTGSNAVYKPQVLGYSGGIETYGATANNTTRTQTTTFVAGNTYKFVYDTPSNAETADGSTHLYECPTTFVGTPLETWTEIMYATGLSLTYSPYSGVKIGIWTNASAELVVDNSVITCGDVKKGTDFLCGGATSEKMEYVAPKTETTVNMKSTGIFGFNENGVDLDFGESLTWMFDVTGDVEASGWWGFCITDGDAKASYTAAYTPSTTVKSNRFNWYGNTSTYMTGTWASNYKYYNAMAKGNTYKLVYTAPSAVDATDGSLIYYSCATAKVGTAEESWTTVGSLTAFGGAYAPVENVKLNLWTNGASLKFTIANSKLVFDDGSELTTVPYTYSTNIEIA